MDMRLLNIEKGSEERLRGQSPGRLCLCDTEFVLCLQVRFELEQSRVETEAAAMRVQELEVTRRGLQQDNAALSLRYIVHLLSVRAA